MGKDGLKQLAHQLFEEKEAVLNLVKLVTEDTPTKQESRRPPNRTKKQSRR